MGLDLNIWRYPGYRSYRETQPLCKDFLANLTKMLEYSHVYDFGIPTKINTKTTPGHENNVYNDQY